MGSEMCIRDSGGEVRSCSVGWTIDMWDIAPLVFIVAAGGSRGFLELKNTEYHFQAGVF